MSENSNGKIYIALLRGINVSGRHKVPMAQLRTLCAKLGCQDVTTYIQSGNVVFSGGSSARALEAAIEGAMDKEFGFAVPVIVRTAANWKRYVRENPFPEESISDSSHVLLALSKSAPNASAAAELQRRATLGERVLAAKGALWIHYAKGIARSKLSPAVIDRCVGSPVTARNWRTVLRIDEMTRR